MSLTGVYFNFFKVPLEDFSTALHIWSGDSDLHIKTTWPDQSTGEQDRVQIL